MYVVSGAQIKALDEAAVEAGIPAGDLMENAGRGVADALIKSAAVKNIVVVAGKGGNGGDAFVAARILREAGFHVRVFTLSSIEELAETTRDKAHLLDERFPGTISVLDDDLVEFAEALDGADCAIDGLLGIGVDRPLSGRYLNVVRAINEADLFRVAIDLPSGLLSDSGAVIGEAIDADLTVCMAAYKPAHLLYPARSYCGTVEVVPVGYPDSLWKSVTPIARVAKKEWIAEHLPVRRPDGHKGTFGHVLVVAGSLGMSGAAILTATAALRAGAGLVTVACPRSIQSIIATALPEAITIGLPDKDGHLTGDSLAPLRDVLARADVLAIGPGLGRADATGAFVRSLIAEVKSPLVLDADGLFALNPETLKRIAGYAVLTPHPGEMSRLIERPADEIDADRIEVARAFAGGHGVVLLLKGRPTAIGTPSGEVFLNPTGNTALATGGSGDVLTGIIAGLLAGGASTRDAAILGAYVHGYAAEHRSRDRAERSIIPSDLLDIMPRAIKEIEDA
ncbi:NAD(P)H-hydrate dehydratase [Candidatus Bipolaricaulota bacterium]|nr:NAD(P)H-hydrate dehydratase [Candidatus Bipolaricaulota bacterium]